MIKFYYEYNYIFVFLKQDFLIISFWIVCVLGKHKGLGGLNG